MNEFLLTVDELRARGGGKWRLYPPDVYPAFVADMDFKVAPAIHEAMRRFVDHQDYVYGLPTDTEALFEAFAGWMQRRHRWSPDPSLTIALDDVVQGLVAAMFAFSQRGDGVLVQTPVYPPFLTTVASTDRQLLESPLRRGQDRYTIDLDALDQAASAGSMLLLCNPHNPTGRVFERSELEAIAAIAERHSLTIVADEIHADLIYAGREHIPMETVAGAAQRTVTITSATKGFNMPGARAAVMHFGSEALRERFMQAVPDHLLGRPSRFGVAATIAAWTGGEQWLADVLDHLAHNRDAVTRWAAARPAFGYRSPEATFLAWLDCTELGLEPDPHAFFLEMAKVGLSDGVAFGAVGAGHVRLNFGTSREILEEILGRMAHALDTR